MEEVFFFLSFFRLILFMLSRQCQLCHPVSSRRLPSPPPRGGPPRPRSRPHPRLGVCPRCTLFLSPSLSSLPSPLFSPPLPSLLHALSFLSSFLSSLCHLSPLPSLLHVLSLPSLPLSPSLVPPFTVLSPSPLHIFSFPSLHSSLSPPLSSSCPLPPPCPQVGGGGGGGGCGAPQRPHPRPRRGRHGRGRRRPTHHNTLTTLQRWGGPRDI